MHGCTNSGGKYYAIGIGERTGNVPLEAMVFSMRSCASTLDGDKLQRLSLNLQSIVKENRVSST